MLSIRCNLRQVNGDSQGQSDIVVFVAIGALLVGSIGWDKGEGNSIKKGDPLGYFQYGGSTVICIFPQRVTFDEDLLRTSRDGLETLVMVGERIGKA